MTYHITVNGQPVCTWPLGTTTYAPCQHWSREQAEAAAKVVRKRWPKHKVEVVDGPCPQQDLPFDS
jgi:hypothetical protein